MPRTTMHEGERVAGRIRLDCDVQRLVGELRQRRGADARERLLSVKLSKGQEVEEIADRSAPQAQYVGLDLRGGHVCRS